MMKTAIVTGLMLIVGPAHAQEHGHDHASRHADHDARHIASLSPDDIAQLRQGAGWGLALAAELNGVPGPAHLLDLKDDIPLDAEQIVAIREIHGRMRADAMAEGHRLIALERDLNEHFRAGTITDDILRRLLAEIAESRKQLRYIHLSTHLLTPGILSDRQIARYGMLRGYGNDSSGHVLPE